jgi:O-antigen/teichoic acid export membrane protein
MLFVLRLSGPELLGKYGLMAAIEVVAIYLSGLELHTFTTRRYARRPSLSRLRLCAACHQRTLVFGAPAAGLAALVAAVALGLALTPPQAACLVLLVASGAVAQEVGRLMVLVNKPVHSVAMSFVRTAVWQPAMVPLLTLAQPLDAMLGLWALASLAGTTWGLWVVRDALGSRCRVPWRYVARGLAQSRAYFVIATSSVLHGHVDRFVLQWYLGPSAVGVLAFFQTLANTLPALVQSAVLNVWLPRLLRDFARKAEDRLVTLGRVCRQCFKVSLLVSALLLSMALPLALITSRPEYLQMLWGLPLLLAGQVLLMWSQPFHLALYGAHHDIVLMVLSLAALAFALTVCIVFVAAFGLVGALLSAPLSATATAAARWALLVGLKHRL